MKNKIIEQDILNIDNGIIAHQVNCHGVMGAGLALQIKYKWMHVFHEYVNYCRTIGHGKKLLGHTQIVHATKNIEVCNLFSQNEYSRNFCDTNYIMLQKCIISLVEYAIETQQQIYFPYKLSCGIAGGNWDIVSELIDRVAPEAIICKLT